MLCRLLTRLGRAANVPAEGLREAALLRPDRQRTSGAARSRRRNSRLP